MGTSAVGLTPTHSDADRQSKTSISSIRGCFGWGNQVVSGRGMRRIVVPYLKAEEGNRDENISPNRFPLILGSFQRLRKVV